MRASWASAWLAAWLLLITPAATAQPELEDTRAFGAWSLAVSQHTQDIIALMEVVNEGLEIAAQSQSGALSEAAARAQAQAWRGRAQQRLDAYADRAEILGRGPSAIPALLAEAADGMAAAPMRSARTARDYFSIVDIYVRDALDGRNPDPNRTTVAQFNVIQIFYQGVSQTNRQAMESVPVNNPQHHLLQAITANTDALILIFEMVRQSYGAAPSQFAVDDIRGDIQRLSLSARGALGTATLTHRTLVSQINTLSAEQLGVTPHVRDVLLAMMATYPESIAVESEGAALMLEGPDNADAAQDPDAWDAFLARVVDYEMRRDTLLQERQRLASEM